MSGPVQPGDPGRAELRRIAWCFFVVVATLPLVALGDAWSLVLLLDLAVAVHGLLTALRLRRIRGSERP